MASLLSIGASMANWDARGMIHMRFYYDRAGKYRGYSIGPAGMLAAALIIGGLALAFSYKLFLLAPVIGLWVLVILAARSEIRRFKARSRSPRGSSSPRTATGSPTGSSARSASPAPAPSPGTRPSSAR